MRSAARVLLCALLVVLCGVSARAEAKRVDTSSGGFSGSAAQYKFSVPKEWNGYVYIERDDPPAKLSAAVEAVNFYCLSESGKSKPAPFMRLYVFKRGAYRDDFGLTMVSRGVLYVFAAEYPKGAFTDKGDKKIFDTVLDSVKTAEKVKSLLTLSDTDAARAARIYVNLNTVMTVPPLTAGGVYYVPIREVCETLGLKVNWHSKSATVWIEDAAGVLLDEFRAAGTAFTDSRGIKMRNVNDRVYVQTAYFTQVLRKTVEIDGNGNVYIYSSR